MRHTLSFLMALAFAMPVFSQLSLDRQVLGTSGHWGKWGQYSLSSTVGETVTTTAITTNGMLILTQGFQQPDDKGDFVGVDDPVELPVSYKIYPNPTNGVLGVELTADLPIVIKLDVIDARGKMTSVPIQRIQFTGSKKTILNLEALADGIYFLNFRDEDGDLLKSEKIQKVH